MNNCGATASRCGFQWSTIHSPLSIILVVLFLLLSAFTSAQQRDTTVDRVEEIGTVTIVEKRQPLRGAIELIDVKMLDKISGASANFENVLKVLPGVQSSNELSSQYSVRGGSFDENLVYVNGVEIFRPMLTRTGQQEGLSFINLSLVSFIEFSTGGFAAEFGDKMSSVLNVDYRKPTQFGGTVEASLLGASASLDFASKTGAFSGVVGLRYKRAAYMLSTLETKGEYNPTYSDIQASFGYDFSSRFSVRFLGTYAFNRYELAPTNRKTSFGTMNNATDFTMYYEGSELDSYRNALAALTAKHRANEDLMLELTASVVGLAEKETYDILAEYFLSETEPSSASSADDNLDVGDSRNHARNYTNTAVYSLAHNGSWMHNGGMLKWGAKADFYTVNDDVSQWQKIDSAGYVIPRKPDGSLAMSYAIYQENKVRNSIYSVFLQETYNLHFANSSQLRLTAGLRGNYDVLSEELLISPRVQAVFYPRSSKNLQLYAATGAYAQPAFFKEMKNASAVVNKSVKAQKSWHVVAGTSAIFSFKNTPCKFTSELYYKKMWDLIPYTQDNVNIVYTGLNMASGYAVGADFKLNAELVKGADSWVSLSLMQARQDIEDDSYVSSNGQAVNPGYLPTPNDQLFNLSVLLQDQVLSYPRWRACLVVNYGAPLPAFAPLAGRDDVYFRMPAYKRVDLGTTYVVHDKLQPELCSKTLRFLQTCTVSVELLNLFNMANVSSYLWVNAVTSGAQNALVAVPNYLTPFRVNVKLAVTF